MNVNNIWQRSGQGGLRLCNRLLKDTQRSKSGMLSTFSGSVKRSAQGYTRGLKAAKLEEGASFRDDGMISRFSEFSRLKKFSCISRLTSASSSLSFNGAVGVERKIGGIRLFTSGMGGGRKSGDGSSLRRTPSFINVSRPKGAGVKTAEDAVNNILYNMPEYTTRKKRHILSIFVDNEAGVLSKVSGMISARGFNIDSLSVSATDVKDLSRMTIVLSGPDAQIEQAKRQLEDLCDVWAVLDFQAPENTFERELLLVKVNCIPPNLHTENPETQQMLAATASGLAVEDIEDSSDDAMDVTGPSYEDLMAVHFHRTAVLEVANLFGAKVSDVGSEHMIIELSSWSARVDAFLRMLQPYGVVEAARSGVIAMGRTKVLEQVNEDEEVTTVIDLADLPPS